MHSSQHSDTSYNTVTSYNNNDNNNYNNNNNNNTVNSNNNSSIIFVSYILQMLMFIYAVVTFNNSETNQ